MGTVKPTAPQLPTDVRPFPLEALRSQVEARLSVLAERNAILAVDREDGTTQLALMVNFGHGFSFAGWMQHTSDRPVGGGAEVRVKW